MLKQQLGKNEYEEIQKTIKSNEALKKKSNINENARSLRT